MIDPTPPFCRHFSRCGGCALHEKAPEVIADLKRESVREVMHRAGIMVDVLPTLTAHGEGRRRVTFHVREEMGKTIAGFMRARSHDLVDIDACPILVPALHGAADLARGIGHILRGINKPLDVQVTACNEGLDVDFRGAGALPEPLIQKLISFALRHDLARLTQHGERLVETRIPTLTLEGTLTAFLPPGSFMQATAQAEALLEEAAFAGLGKSKCIADLFCGLGPFALRLARKMKVAAYDADKPAIEALSRSIRANPGGKPLTAEARDLFRRPLFAPELKAFDAVLLDPPRQGAQAQVGEIAKSTLTKVVYISCAPESFARDAKVLLSAGFKLEPLLPVDQFRFSRHVELVGVFTR